MQSNNATCYRNNMGKCNMGFKLCTLNVMQGADVIVVCVKIRLKQCS